MKKALKNSDEHKILLQGEFVTHGIVVKAIHHARTLGMSLSAYIIKLVKADLRIKD